MASPFRWRRLTAHCVPACVRTPRGTARSVPFVSRVALWYGATREDLMKNLTLIALIIVGTLTASPALAETSTLAGTLSTALSGDPVANALITLQSGTTSRQARSGADGKYSFSEVAAGNYELTIRVDGFLPSKTSITVNGPTLTSDIQLNPELHFTEVTSVSPEAKDSFVSFQSTESLGGQQLTQELQPTLGATLENQVGVALRSFGPGPARPV